MFSYIFQFVNIAVALLTVPLLLRHLTTHEYGLWLLFSATCGATVQVQSAILGVSTKEIANAYHRGSRGDFLDALAKARRSYLMLSAFVGGPLLFAAAVYFLLTYRADAYDLGAWALLAGSYALVYFFAPNNAVLLATDRIDVNNAISTATRLIYFGGNWVLLMAGFSILAPCIALAASSIVGVIANTFAAHRRVVEVAAKTPDGPSSPVLGSIRRYVVYAFSSFMLYNGALLVVAPMFPADAASYGLALQTSTLISTVALVPLQLYLGRIVRAQGFEDEARELKRALVVCNLLFATGYAGLILIAPALLAYIDSQVLLPPASLLLLMYLAFCVEVNIFVLVNHLTAKGDYGFANRYASVAVIALSVGVLSAWLFGILWLGFLLIPMAFQILFNVSYIVRRVIIRMHAVRTHNV